jgi:hypothetical protein
MKAVVMIGGDRGGGKILNVAIGNPATRTLGFVFLVV